MLTRLTRQQNFAVDWIFQELKRQRVQESWIETKDQLKFFGIGIEFATFDSLSRWCGNAKPLSDGRDIHSRIANSGFERSKALGSPRLQRYGNCRTQEEAGSAFSSMQQRDVPTWKFLIASYARHRRSKEVLLLFDQMKRDGMTPDKVTLINVLSAFDDTDALFEGKAVHAYIKDNGLESDVILGTALVNMYSKCGSLKDAWMMFDKLPKKDVVLWTAMITAYTKYGHDKEALELFNLMQQEDVIPDTVTFISILNACSSHEALAEGKHLHDIIVRSGFESDTSVATALLNMYAKTGNMKDAQRIFDKKPKQNLVTWNAMITSYTKFGSDKCALQLFHQLLQEGVTPDAVTFVSILQAVASQSGLIDGKQMHIRILATQLESNAIIGSALLNMYGKCRSLQDARSMFDMLFEKNVVAWSAMISVYTQHGLGQEAFELFDRMRGEAVLPNQVTCVSFLEACAIQRVLLKGKQMHACIVNSGYMSDVAVVTALVYLYGKCGILEAAWRLFKTMAVRDVVLWTTLITVYAMHGQAKMALQLFNQMQQEGVVPNKVTYICMLNACASLSAQVEGKQIHTCIAVKGFALDVDVETALVDMYGKCGNLEYACRMFDTMPVRDNISWSAMIAAYAQHGRGKDALIVFEQMVQKGLLPDTITFLSILSACSHSGLMDVGFYLFDSMSRDYGITPTVCHYDCIIDLLGRAGQLNKAECLIKSMPVQSTVVSWTTLLGACRKQVDVERGEQAAKRMFELEPQDPAPYITLSNLYAVAGREEDAAEVLIRMQGKDLKEQQGCNSI